MWNFGFPVQEQGALGAPAVAAKLQRDIAPLSPARGTGQNGGMDFLQNHMIIDPALQSEICARAMAGRFGDQPDRAAHDLGLIALPDGRTSRVWLRHAADAVITDAAGQVVLITRAHNPGAGKLALPGGFMDEVDGAIETVLDAAIREAVEETGIDAVLLRAVAAAPLGPRRFNRPFDIRMAWNNILGTAIRKDEIFCVSTQGIGFRLSHNLRDVRLAAGDDAAGVQVVAIDALSTAQFAVPDHLEMVREAAS